MSDTVNEYGTPVMAATCKTCGEEFTVTPTPNNPEDWESCLGPHCDSYDPDRDFDSRPPSTVKKPCSWCHIGVPLSRVLREHRWYDADTDNYNRVACAALNPTEPAKDPA